MVRHMVRHVVKHGEYRQFLAAIKAFNETAPLVGLPPYRVFQSLFGTINEVWTEADFETVQANVDAFATARGKHEAFDRAFLDMLSHLVDGEQRDYILEEAKLD